MVSKAACSRSPEPREIICERGFRRSSPWSRSHAARAVISGLQIASRRSAFNAVSLSAYSFNSPETVLACSSTLTRRSFVSTIVVVISAFPIHVKRRELLEVDEWIRLIVGDRNLPRSFSDIRQHPFQNC